MTPAPCPIVGDLNDGSSVILTIAPTSAGPQVRAEVIRAGQVVGRIDVSYEALKRAIGLAQRAFQPEHCLIDRTA